MKERESKVQSKTMKAIRLNKGYVYKNAQNMYTEVGRPDLCACIPIKIKTLLEMYGEDATVGLFVGIEMKREGLLRNVSEAQKIVGHEIQKASGIWMAIDNEEDIIKFMKTMKVKEENDV